MAMVENEGARAMEVVRPGPSSLTPGKKTPKRSWMGITRLVLHAGTRKDSLEYAGEASEVGCKSFRPKKSVLQIILPAKYVRHAYLTNESGYRSETFRDVVTQCEGETFCALASWYTTMLDYEQVIHIQNGFRRLKHESISRVTSAIHLKFSEGLEHTTMSEYLECEVVRCCAFGSRATLHNSPIHGHTFSLVRPKFTARSVLRNGHHDYMCDCVCVVSCF